VSREIRYERGAILVEDSLRLSGHFAVRNYTLNLIFDKLEHGDTNILQLTKELLKEDNVEVDSYRAEISAGRVDLSIFSKVVFGGTNQVAKLKWVPFWGGLNVGFPNGHCSEMKLVIYKSGKRAVLWFPDLGAVESEFLAELDSYRKLMEFTFEGADIVLSCRLRQGAEWQRLLYWCPESKVPGPLDSDTIRRMHRRHGMSLNDVYSLFTNLKVAKSGCYHIPDLNVEGRGRPQ